MTPLPAGFVPNAGQFDGDTLCVARVANASLIIRPNGWVFVTRAATGDRRVSQGVGFELVGADQGALELDHPLPARLSYLGADGDASDLAAFEVATLRSPYEGVDVVFRITEGRFEYDLHVSDPSLLDQVRIRVHGADSLCVSESGDVLTVPTTLGDIEQTFPASWQEFPDGRREPITTTFDVESDGVFSFDVDAEPGAPIVIDPLLFSTLIGGGSWDRVVDVSQNDGVITFVGHTAKDTFHPPLPPSTQLTNPAPFPTTAGALFPTPPTSNFAPNEGWNWPLTDGHQIDSFVSQVDSATGTLLLSTFLGSDDNEYVQCVHVDEGTGIVTIGGATESKVANASSTQVTINAYQNGYIGGPQQPSGTVPRSFCFQGGFIMQLDPAQSGAGQLVYGTTFAGSGQDRVNDVHFDGVDRITFCGTTTSSDIPLTGTPSCPSTPSQPIQATHRTPNTLHTFVYFDAFLAQIKVGANCTTLEYGTYIGGTDFDQASELIVDGPDRVILGGTTASTDMPVAQPLFNQNASTPGQFWQSTDAWVAVVLPNEPLVGGAKQMRLDYSTYLGGGQLDVLEGLDYDPASNEVVICGNTQSNDPGSGGVSRAFKTTFTAYQNSPPSPLGRNCATTSNGIPSFNFYQHGFVSRIALGSVKNSTPSSLVWSTFLGGATNDTLVTFCDILRGGEVIVGGTTWATDLLPPGVIYEDPLLGFNGDPTAVPPIPGDVGTGVDCTCIGQNAADGFIVRLDRNGTALVNGRYFGGAQDDYIWAGDTDERARVAVGGWTHNSGFRYVRNGAGVATGLAPNLPDTFPTTSNATYSSYTYPEFLFRAHFGSAMPFPWLLSPLAPVAPTTNYFETGHLSDGALLNGRMNAGDAFVALLEMHPRGISINDRSIAVANCQGVPTIDANVLARTGDQTFTVSCINAPPNTVGALMLGAPLAPPAQVDNILIEVTPWVSLDVVSDASGESETLLPLTGAAVSATLSFQYVWVTTPQCPADPATGALSSSNRLDVVIVP